MDLRKLLLTKNECYKMGVKMTPKGIMWHSTGANNPNLKRYVNPDDGKLGVNQYGNHWNQFRPDGRKVCVHAFIGLDKYDKVATYQTLPFNVRGWHSGGTANKNYIGFEICEDDLKNESYFNKVYKEACEFTAYLCKKYNLDPMGKDVIICHYDGYKLGIASNHGDVYNWFKRYGRNMDDVRKDVKKLMTTNTSTTTKVDDKPTTSTFKPFKVRVSIDNLLIRSTPSIKDNNVKGYCPKGSFTIVDSKKDSGYTWGKLKSGIGWIALEHTTKVE